MLLTACGQDATPTTAPAAPSTAPTATTAPAAPSGDKVTLTIESWRNDDLSIWSDKIIPAFEAKNPNIHVVFAPTAPTEYNAALNTKLEGGTAGDLITCRPFDVSLGLYQQGRLVALNDLPGMDNFGDVAKSAWITDDGKNVFCVPMASVIHGFIYNKDAFDKLGLKPPTTMDEFMAVLEAIKKDGTYIPLAMGTSEQWEAATMGFQNIGPNYWHGEDGRLALIAGKQKFTDAAYVDTFKELAAWKPYMPPGFEAQKYADSQSMFTLGRAAIYPAGSWEISLFNQQAKFKMGAFPPPLPKAGDTSYISDHTDIAMGMNAASKHQAEATHLPRLDGDAGVRHALQQRPARLLHPVEPEDHAARPAGADVPGLAQHQQIHHPQLVPDSLARRPEPGERAMAAERRGDQRHHHPRASREGSPGRAG